MKKVKYKDLEFESISECGRYFGINFYTIARRIQRGKSCEEAIDMILAGREKCWRDHLGNTFKTLREMCKFHGVNFFTASARLYNQGFTIERALNPNSFMFTYNGKTYPSIAQFLRERGKIPHKWYRFRIKHKNLPKEKVLEMFLTEK